MSIAEYNRSFIPKYEGKLTGQASKPSFEVPLPHRKTSTVEISDSLYTAYLNIKLTITKRPGQNRKNKSKTLGLCAVKEMIAGNAQSFYA